MSTFKFGVGARYYIVNKDKFNFFVGPNVGFLTGKDKTEYFGVEIDDDSKTKYSGLNLGLDAGINFYFTDMIGGIVKLGYDNNMTTGKVSEEGVDYDWKRNYGGVKIAAGVAFKF
jgi:L-2-hydroxyglutarate oxidase LhgO